MSQELWTPIELDDGDSENDWPIDGTPSQSLDEPLPSVPAPTPPPPGRSSPSSRGRQTSALCRWAFTVNAGGRDLAAEVGNFKKLLSTYAKAWTFQLEQAPTTGSLHYQGRVSLKTRKRKQAVCQLLWNAHVSPEYNTAASSFYALKEESRVDGPWCDKDPPVCRKYDGLQLNEFQKDVMNKLDAQDDRRFLFIVDLKGNHGKTMFARYLFPRRDGFMVPTFMENPQEIMECIMAKVRDVNTTYTVAVDFPRDTPMAKFSKWMPILEYIKNGFACDRRYGWKEKMFNPPRMVVFSNRFPPKESLSADRFQIFTVQDDTQGVYQGLVPFTVGQLN